MAWKYKHYIAVKTGKRTWRYVTGILPNNYVEWAMNKPAKSFNMTVAKDIQMGLTCNMFLARIEILPDFVEVGNGKFKKGEK